MKHPITQVLESDVQTDGFLKAPLITKWYPLRHFWRRFVLRHKTKGVLKKELDAVALEAWREFFETEQDTDVPHGLWDFAKMVCMHGVPDVGNVYVPQDEGFLSAHNGGFLAQMIEWILVPAGSERSQRFAASAKDRIGFLLYINAPMVSVLKYWERQDIQLACAIALLEGEYELAGIGSRIALRHALLGQWIDPALTLGLAANREWVERERYPSWWKRAHVRWRAWRRSRMPVKKLDVATWRSHRMTNAKEPPKK